MMLKKCFYFLERVIIGACIYLSYCVDELNRETSPNDIKWMTAMNELAGSADKAKAIFDEWSGLIAYTIPGQIALIP